jgi:hypothetical protein
VIEFSYFFGILIVPLHLVHILYLSSIKTHTKFYVTNYILVSVSLLSLISNYTLATLLLEGLKSN